MAETLIFSISKLIEFNENFKNAPGILLSLILVLLTLYWLKSKTNENFPPGPTGIPLLGYLPFLGTEPYRELDRLRKKYGNVFSLYMGRTYVVILGDYEAVKEAFGRSTTTDRPPKLFDALPDAVGFSSVNGQEWIEQRRYCVRAMRDIGLGRSRWESQVQTEVDDFMDILSKYSGKPVNFCNLLTTSVNNNIATLIFGRRLPDNEETEKFVTETMEKVMQSFAQAGLRNYFPLFCDFLAYLGVSKYASTEKTMMELNKYIRKEIEQQKETFQGDGKENFIHGYLSEIKNNTDKNLGNTFNERNLRGNVQAFFLAGTDTTRTSINWLFLIMANFVDIQEKVHKELASVLGKDGKIQWSDRSLLPYTLAVILEGQRWRTIAPLNTSRVAMEDMKIGGYDVLKGTTIIANNWGLHNDPKYWDKPEQFKPERFLIDDGKKVDFRAESYVPFSYGKRSCPGETVALIEILLYFVAILQKYRVLPPEGSQIKMQGILGLTYQAVEQNLLFIPKE